MMYAKISNGQLITAKIISDPSGKHDANAESPTIPEGWQLVESEAAAEEVENGFPVLSRKQLRFALLSMSVTGAMVNTLIDSIEDDVERETVRIFWEDSKSFHREHEMVAYMVGKLGKDAETIDDAWMKAAAITG